MYQRDVIWIIQIARIIIYSMLCAYLS